MRCFEIYFISKHYTYVNRCATSQTIFRESMILSLIISSYNLLSSRDLVKISMSCSLVLTCEINMSPLMA
jgi:hypothetical protein